jgi:hypothetical protein
MKISLAYFLVGWKVHIENAIESPLFDVINGTTRVSDEKTNENSLLRVHSHYSPIPNPITIFPLYYCFFIFTTKVTKKIDE